MHPVVYLGGLIGILVVNRFSSFHHNGYVLRLIRRSPALVCVEELRFSTFSDFRGSTTTPAGARSRPSPVQP